MLMFNAASRGWLRSVTFTHRDAAAILGFEELFIGLATSRWLLRNSL
jgi:hypothetical protein